jgi:predicted DNA-binding transcriptional regulator AlpA
MQANPLFSRLFRVFKFGFLVQAGVIFNSKVTHMETATSASKPKPVSDALRNFDSLPDSANVGKCVVAALFNCSSVTVWRRCKTGSIPKPYVTGPQSRVWNVGELRAALRALRQTQTRDAA